MIYHSGVTAAVVASGRRSRPDVVTGVLPPPAKPVAKPTAAGYFTSSKTTLTDYQCVSAGCCTHAVKTEIIIDNQRVTNIIAEVQIYLQTTKRKHRKNHKPMIFLDSDCLLQVCPSYISVNPATFLIQPISLYITSFGYIKRIFPKSIFNQFFKFVFLVFLQKSNLNRKKIYISLVPY